MTSTTTIQAELSLRQKTQITQNFIRKLTATTNRNATVYSNTVNFPAVTNHQTAYHLKKTFRWDKFSIL